MTIKNVLFVLVTICVAVSVNAQLQQYPIIFSNPLPFLRSTGILNLPDVKKCFSSVRNVPGCLLEISQAFGEKFGHMMPACCKAFMDSIKCMPNILYSVLFPPNLKEQCNQAGIH
ncbi:Prolamin-like domain [Arabidopsis suecica]|uniref:ECA1 gametogenesis related family protein n=2 Tax=Arabidopsis TaxID=3701 RepID=A8MQI9_ARATH|nr:ECA1 gametogenesis related family protein [Arabidopsis thaliana]AEC07542.1 ECA1 gametogenesis related family protein [Arabidopsis thaliana]KAG7641876.1 Prolamin-like domain [Arabidopsis suecica]|eukprot:NP_001077952.1 ECA1 gametogenesis related family protein [Arabidopsis thaliana]